MLVKSEAIVLHSFHLDDRKMVVAMFTREQGRLSFVVYLPKTAKGKLRKQYFQPLTLLQIEADVRPAAQFQRLKDTSLLSPLSSLLTDPVKLSVTLFLSEFLYHALKGEQQNAPLFDYVRNSIEWLDGCTGTAANFHLVFVMRLSRFLGFFPNTDHYTPGSCFDLRASVFCPSPPLHHDYLMPQEAEKVQLMMRMDYATMHLFRMSHHERQRLLDIILAYYRIHLPAFPELRSLSVLQELYKQP